MATTRYVTQAGAGTHDGLSLVNAWSVSEHNAAGATITVGDLIWLDGTRTSQVVCPKSGSAGNVITYKFTPGSKFSKAQWGVDSAGAIYANGKSYICIDGDNVGKIENTDNGDALGTKQPSTAIFLNACSDIEIKNLNILDIFIHTFGTVNPGTVSTYQTNGVKSSNGNRVLVHDCVMRNMYMAVYFYTETAVTITGNKAYDNIISACSTGLIAACGASGSAINSTYLYNNDIAMGLNWYEAPNENHIDGIHTWTGSSGAGSMTGLYIYGNYIHGDPSTHCTGHIFVTDNVVSAYIFNNLCIGDYDGTNHPGEGYINFNLYAGSEVWVLYNTIYGNSADSNGGNGISHDPGNTGSTIHAKGNICMNCTMAWYDAGQFTSTFDFADNCYNGNQYFGRWGSTYYSSLGTLQAITGDTNTISTNPGLDSNFKYTSASPAYQRGTDITSVVPGGLLAFYRDGTARPAGAMNLGSESLQGAGGGSAQAAPKPLAKTSRVFCAMSL